MVLKQGVQLVKILISTFFYCYPILWNQFLLPM